MSEGMIYDANAGAEVPAIKAALYMKESWLDHFSCHQTTLDWIAEAERLRRLLTQCRNTLAAAGYTSGTLYADLCAATVDLSQPPPGPPNPPRPEKWNEVA